MEKFTKKIFYLKKKIIFPNCNMHVSLKESDFTKGLNKGDKILSYPIKNIFGVFFNKNKLATLSEIIDINHNEQVIKIELKGLARARIKKIHKLQQADFELIKVRETDVAYREILRKKAQELIFLINVDESDKLINLLNFLVNIDQMTDFISNYFIIDFKNRYKLFYELNLERRIKKLIASLNILIQRMKNKLETTNA